MSRHCIAGRICHAYRFWCVVPFLLEHPTRALALDVPRPRSKVVLEIWKPISMRLYIARRPETCNNNDYDDDERRHHTDRSANMRATPIDRAISKHSNLMLLSFTGLVVAAFSYVTFFGTLPTVATPEDKAVSEEDEEMDEEYMEEETADARKKNKGKRKEQGKSHG
ncbi:hypothetical protein V1517DRAFT_33121 [Lipomyces orientalis]|uniref:Uncharacterized protein n=1 Tax=Lipomyces orientalis TaxID=1233043 RepID=A0ACC3TEZ4_9ASCO